MRQILHVLDYAVKIRMLSFALQKELEVARIIQQEKASEARFQGQSLDDSVPSSEEISRLKGEVEVGTNLLAVIGKQSLEFEVMVNGKVVLFRLHKLRKQSSRWVDDD